MLGVQTGQSFRGWRKKRSIAVSDTSWGRCTPGRRRHRRYHLRILISPLNPPLSCSPISPAHFTLRTLEPRQNPPLDLAESKNGGGGWEVQHTDGGRLNHVTDGESLDGLVLGGTSGAIGATDGLDVATTLLVTSAIKTRESASRFIPIHIQSNPTLRRYRRLKSS